MSALSTLAESLAGTAANEVADAVAGEQRVVAVLAVEQVVAAAAGQGVVADAAEERVLLLGAGEAVVAVAAVGLDGHRHARLDEQRVVAAEAVDLERLGGRDVERERTEVGAVEPHALAVRSDLEGVARAGGAVDLDLVEAGSPSMTSLPSPLFQTSVSSPALAVHGVVAAVADDAVDAGAAVERVVVVAAVDEVGAGAAAASCRGRCRR